MPKPIKPSGPAKNDFVEADENGVLAIDALANDGSGKGQFLSVNQADLWSPSEIGSWYPLNDGASLRIAGGMIEYDPGQSYDYLQAGEQALETFVYSSTQKNGKISLATVTVTIHGENDAPVAWADGYSTDANKTLVVTTKGVLANDFDPDSAGLVAVLVDGPAHGDLDLNEDGTFTYTPATGYAGQDSFTYKPSDGLIDGNTVTVTIGVDGAESDSYATDEDAVLTVSAADGVLANDVGVSKATTAATVNLPRFGSLEFNPDGSFTYTPFADFYGADSFTYQSYDGENWSGVTTVELTVAPALDPTADQTAVIRVFTEDQGSEPWLFDGSNFQVLDLTPGANSTFVQQFLQAGDRLLAWYLIPGVQTQVDSIDAAGNTSSFVLESQNVFGAHGRLFAIINANPAEIDPGTGAATPLDLPFPGPFSLAIIDDSLFVAGHGGLSRLDLATDVWSQFALDDSLELFNPGSVVGDYLVGHAFTDGGFGSKIVSVDLNTGEFQTILDDVSFGNGSNSIKPANGDLYFFAGHDSPNLLLRVNDETGEGSIVGEFSQVTFQPLGPADGIYVTGSPLPDLPYGLYRIDPETGGVTLLFQGFVGDVYEFQGEHYFAKGGDADSALYKWDQDTGDIILFHDFDPERIFEEVNILGVVNGELAVSWRHNDDLAVWTYDGTDWQPHFPPDAIIGGGPIDVLDGDYLNEALGQVITFPIA